MSLNKIEYLGFIVEVEALANNQQDIPALEKRILSLMKELDLKELGPYKYERMMINMHSKTLKLVSEQVFSFR